MLLMFLAENLFVSKDAFDNLRSHYSTYEATTGSLRKLMSGVCGVSVYIDLSPLDHPAAKSTVYQIRLSSWQSVASIVCLAMSNAIKGEHNIYAAVGTHASLPIVFDIIREDHAIA